MCRVEKGELVSKLEKREVSFVVKDRESGKALYMWDTEFTDHGGHGFSKSNVIFQQAILSHAEQRLRELFKVDVKVHTKGWKPKK